MIYKDIKHDLSFYPALRERKNKNHYIANKIKRKHKLDNARVELLTEMVADVLLLDRGWRYVLQHDPKLRGQDYGDKKVLEQAKKGELGYQGGQDVDEFKKLIDSF